MDASLLTVGLTFILASAVVFIIALLASRSWKTQSETELEEREQVSADSAHQKPSTNDRKAPKKDKFSGKDKNAQFDHQWLVANLKGHTGRVLDLDFSPNGKYVITCDQDRGLILWHTKDIELKDHRLVRGKVELDTAKLVRFAPDSVSIVMALENSNTLAVYKIHKKEQGVKIAPVENVHFSCEHKQDISNIGISCNGQFLMSVSSDNCLIIWDLKGNVLKTIDTKQSTLYHGAVSPCGRYVATCGFTPDVKVFYVNFDRSGNFVDAQKAFDLTGHSSGVLGFDFNQDSSRMISCSKDCTWRLYDTNIEWKLGQTSYVLKTGKLSALQSVLPENVKVSMSPNGYSFAIAINRDVHLFTYDNSEAVGCIKDVHSSVVTALKFSPDNRLLLSCGDKHSHVFLNVSGYIANVHKLRHQLNDKKNISGEAHEQRLKEQLKQDLEILVQVGVTA